jgi:hypothetical protein
MCDRHTKQFIYKNFIKCSIAAVVYPVFGRMRWSMYELTSASERPYRTSYRRSIVKFLVGQAVFEKLRVKVTSRDLSTESSVLQVTLFKSWTAIFSLIYCFSLMFGCLFTCPGPIPLVIWLGIYDSLIFPIT